MEKEVEQYKNYRPDDPTMKTKALMQLDFFKLLFFKQFFLKPCYW